MAISQVQNNGVLLSGSANPGATFSSNVAVGNVVLALAEIQGASTTCTSMSFTSSGTATVSAWTPAWGSIQSPVGGTVPKFIMGAFATVTAGGTLQPILNSNALNIGNSNLIIVEFTGFTAAAALDKALSAASGVSTTINPLSFVGSFANTAYIAYTNINSGLVEVCTLNAPFNLGVTNLATGGFVGGYAVTNTQGTTGFGGTWSTAAAGNTMVSCGFSVGFTPSAPVGTGVYPGDTSLFELYGLTNLL